MSNQIEEAAKACDARSDYWRDCARELKVVNESDARVRAMYRYFSQEAAECGATIRSLAQQARERKAR